jgi:hypothetical protein
MEKAGGIHRPFFVLAAFLSVELPLPAILIMTFGFGEGFFQSLDLAFFR